MNENICGVHNEIKEKADEIMRYSANNFNSVENALYELQNLTDDIYKLADKAKKMGQNMEDRLDEYYQTIIGLGFKRD